MSTASFEKKMAQLTAINEHLSDDTLSLDQAFKSFQKGLKLSQDCEQILNQTHDSITALLENSEQADNDNH